MKPVQKIQFIKDLNVIGKAVSFWVISTFGNHLHENKSDNDLITIEIGTDTLSIDKVTAAVRLNTQVTYADILGESVSKTTKRNLTFVILNIKSVGYKLSS